MVKLNGVKDQRITDSNSAPTSSTGLICFICGASNANWPVYCRSRNSEKMPFFPFLEYHERAEGARPMDKENGRVDSCTVCFSFLTQQWHAFEANETPVIKRIYWLKRSGPETSSERSQSPVVNSQDGGEESVNNFNTIRVEELNPEQCLEVQSDEPSEGTATSFTMDINVNPISEDPTGSLLENTVVSSGSRRSGGLETCYICSRRKPKEFMRSVHTRPQLKTETPFYPCLAKHAPPTMARQMDYLGKVLVCEACQKFLFRQWQVFQKNSTPLSERQYQLRSDPSLPREQQSQLSTMVCFICGVTQPATSGRFLYSRKHAPGHPYYPFLNNLATPEGAMPLTKQGLTRACSGCRKSLIRQWKQFEAIGIDEEKREYRIRNDVMVQPGTSITEFAEMTANVACFTCGQHCCEAALQPVHSKPNTNPLKDNFYFPFLASLKPPKDCRPLDAEGQTFICKKCSKQLTIEWEEFEKQNVPQEERSYGVKALAEDPDVLSVCFLCGVSVSAIFNFKLYSYPHSGKGIHDGGPFFPFLSSREPAYNAKAIDSEGTAVTCEICYNNLMMQWNAYEGSDIPEESNRWLRKYMVASITCFLCCKQSSRASAGAVNKQLITFPSHHKPPNTGILLNNGRDVVLCGSCQREVRKDLEAMDDSCDALGMKQQEQNNEERNENPLDSRIKATKTRHTNKGRVIVIDSSEESEEGDGSSSQPRNKRATLNTNRQSSNASPMHYKTSSPGLQPVLHNKESTPAPTDSSMSGGQASFAAALRKLAKQAKPTPSSTSSPTPSENSSQSVSPSISAISGKSAGMSPSRTSPPAGQTEREMNTKERGESQGPAVVGIRTPPVPNVPPLDPDHRNHRPGEQNRDSSRGSQRAEVSHPRMGHEVMPGVFASMPRGHSEVPMLSEHYPPEPPHAPVAFYPAYGAKPDLPIYVPRGAHPPGPPPLLASKRDGPEAHMLPAFYPTPYPPQVLDPHDIRFSTWRQQRAAEHLRQQHERHSILPDGTIIVEPFDIPVGHVGDAARHLPPGSVESFVRKNSPHLQRPGENAELRETRKQEAGDSTKKDKENDGTPGEPKRSSAEGSLQQGLYHEHKQGSCPVHGHGTPTGAPTSSSSEPPRSHGLHVRSDPALASKMTRPGEYKRMFLPAHEVPVLHPFLVHPPRDAPFPLHPLDERHAEFVRRERQEFLLHEQLMFEQKEGLRAAPGEDWPRHHMQQDKPPGLGVLHYPQPLHQQRLEASKSPLSVEHHKGDPSLARLAVSRESDHLYRGFPFHPFHPPPPDGKGFGDRYGNDLDIRHLQAESMRRSAGGPSEQLGVRESPYLDTRAFGRETFHSSIPRMDRGNGESEWRRRDRAALVNGDFHHDGQRPKSSDRSSPSLAKRIKVERATEETQVKATNKIRHDPYKLRFLEGLGLVTADRKKEISQGDPTLKRKYEGDHDNENGVDSPSNATSDANVNGSNDDNHSVTPAPPIPSPEKLDFMAKLGLLPPIQRQELEQSYEIKRTERKNRKSRGRPPKRARRDKENDRDSDNSQGSLDPDAITGPITRQKQQLLQEQEKKENRNKDAEKQPVTIKTEEGEKRTTPYSFDNRNYRRSSNERFQQSPSDTNHLPPRLTLQSLTNMEDPFSNVSASQFRPPYLRHTGLLSISHEHGSVTSHVRQDHRPVTQPIRPEPLRSTGISLSEKETRDYLSQHSPGIQGRQFTSLPLMEQQSGSRNKQGVPVSNKEKCKSSEEKNTYKWCGIEAAMQSYYAHAAERGLEIGVLQDNADLLKSQNTSLNEEAQALSLQMTNLVQAKKELQEERNSLRDGLDKLHFFIESLKR